MSRGLEMDDPIEVVSPEQFKALEKTINYETPAGGFKLPSGYLSNSQVEMYLRCPTQYEFRYVKNVRSPPSAAMSHGRGTHKALEVTHHHIVDHGEPASTEEVESAFSDEFDGVLAEIPKEAQVEDGLDLPQLKNVGLSLIRIYNSKYAPAVRPSVGTDGVRGIEKRFSVLVAGVPMVGVIDLIDTNSEGVLSKTESTSMALHGKEIPAILRTAIADFKTKSKSMSETEVVGSLQLTLYSYVEQIPAVRIDQLLKLKTPKITRITALRTSRDHAWLKHVVYGVAKAIHAGVFPPCDPTAWVCSEKWCGYWSSCRGRKV